jgi:TRAP transporter TAXI family solute receptor
MYYITFTMTDLLGNKYDKNAVKVVLNRDNYAFKPQNTLIMGTGGTAGTYYPYANAIAATLMNHIDDLDISVIPTGASQANIYSIANKAIDIAIAQNDVLDYAISGTSLFVEPVNGFSAVAGLYSEACQIVARPGINSISDLKGKNVSIGNVGSGTSFNAVQILEAYDMTLMDIKIFNLNFSDSVAAFRDGTIDAFVCVAGEPTAAISELALTHDIVLLEIDDERSDRLIEEYPFYTLTKIEGGKYRGVDITVQTIAVKAVLIAADDLGEDLVYEITKVLFESQNEIITSQAMGVFLDPANAIKGITDPFHPGAVRYYREIGILE